VKLLTRFIDWLLLTRLFLACCAAGLCISSETLFNGAVPPFITPLHALVFGSALVVYNLPGLLKKRKPVQENKNKAHLWGPLFFTAGVAIIAVSAPWLDAKMLLWSGVLGLCSFAYSYPLLPFKNAKRLRDIGWLKILVLAGVWTISTAILPLLYWHKDISLFPFEIVQRFILIFVLCFVFDMRDLRIDEAEHINTLPAIVGERNCQRLINLSLSVFVAISLAQYFRYPLHGRLAAAFCTAIATKAIIDYLKKNPSERAYDGLVDGVMLLYAVCAAAPL
jgi:1,4-dihydroxy-2-naphthoate octaprenyltransferase